MSLDKAVIRHVAAEPDKERRYRLATAMLAGQDTDVLEETYAHAIAVQYGKAASHEERAAARIVVEMLALVLLARVQAMDEEHERLLDEVVTLQFGDCEEPFFYDSDEGFMVALDPEPEEVPGDDDLMLDLWAEAGTICLSMRVNRDEGPRLTGSLAVTEASYLQRGLWLVADDAATLAEQENVAEGEQD